MSTNRMARLRASKPEERRAGASQNDSPLREPGTEITGIVERVDRIDSDYQKDVPLVVLREAAVNGQPTDDGTIEIACWHAATRYKLGEVAVPGDEIGVVYLGKPDRAHEYEIIVLKAKAASNTDLPVTEPPADKVTAVVESSEEVFG